MTQFDEEMFDTFVQRLRDKAKLCDFEPLDKELNLQIIKGCKSSSLKKKLFQSKNSNWPNLSSWAEPRKAYSSNLKSSSPRTNNDATQR